MSLTPGTRIGVYQVGVQLGVGGMGEVYQATDTNLKRQVAIKVLPASVAGDAERLARFQREAEVLAALNHPNIAAVYGLEKTPDVTALVMELVEGEDLSQRLAKGAIPLDEALPIARQIAEALEAAHEQGIIHRDLKPANIKVRADGTVKVLDFGLAKAMEPAAGPSPSLSQSPTITTPAMTQAGMLLGTAAYMSPEQARGKTVDRRADIWAFGCVLFEMLTGKRAFEGEGVSETLARVLEREPDWSRLPAKVSPALRSYLERCLHKDPRQRIRDIGDVRLALEGAFETAVRQTTGSTASPPRSSITGKLPMGIAAGLAIVAVAALWGWWRASRPVEESPRALVRLEVDLGSDVSLSSVPGADAILSPDGTRIVYVSQRRLFTRRLDQPNASELPGTEGAFAPFFSPDGQWVAFFAAGALKKISVVGGAAVVLAKAVNGRGGSWGEDGTIIAALATAGGLSRIPAVGGAPVPVTVMQDGEATHRWPQILPGGKAVLFTASTTGAPASGSIAVLSLADQGRKTLVRGGTYGRYVPSGHLVYANGGTLLAVPFDVERQEVRGTPVPVVDQVRYSAGDGSAEFAFSQDGTMLYRGGAEAGLLRVAWLDGDVRPLLAKPGTYGRPNLSPDGQRLALEVTEESGTDIWVYDWPRDTMTRLTFTGTAVGPVWSPDGRHVAFRVNGKGMSAVLADGAGQPRPLSESKNAQFPHSFSPDGKRLAFMEQSASSAWDLWTMPVESDSAGLRGGKPEPLLQTAAEERYPIISPDGRWMAYASNESGTYQVYVRAFPDAGGKWQVSNGGGSYPMWSRAKHELFFETLDNRIMVATYTVKGQSFEVDKPRVWSETQLAGTVNSVKNVDLAPDGKRIVALMPVQSAEGQKAQSQVTFLENFFDELRRTVPVSR